MILFIIEGGGMSTESFSKQIVISEEQYDHVVNTEVDKRYDEVRLANKVSLTKDQLKMIGNIQLKAYTEKDTNSFNLNEFINL